jgi:hypothetical protein
MLMDATQITTAILKHRLGDLPTQDLVDGFLIRRRTRLWEDGYHLTVFVGSAERIWASSPDPCCGGESRASASTAQ